MQILCTDLKVTLDDNFQPFWVTRWLFLIETKTSVQLNLWNLNHMSHSPCHVQLAFHCLLHLLPVDKSWAGDWEQVYSFNTQCESESCLTMITPKKQSLSKFFCCGGMPSICIVIVIWSEMCTIFLLLSSILRLHYMYIQ